MSKSILVVDTPKKCLDCKFCRKLYEGIEACCEISDKPDDKELCRMIEVDYCQEKPNWCPIRDLPEKKEENKYNNSYEKGMKDGFNTCINEILKGDGAE